MARQLHNSKDREGRLERDALGERRVPARARYGIQTLRATENFALGGDTLSDHPSFVVALAHVKAAAAKANRDLGAVEPALADAIVAAAREVAAGELLDQFPLEIVQGGGGTSTHMNVNEVLAHRASEILGSAVHPNDHVNRSQSTNDVVPTAMGIAIQQATETACSGLARLQRELLAQAAAHHGLEHLGRTCLQDAVPLSVSSVHAGQAHAVGRAAADLRDTARKLLSVPLGGTAVGTGLGAPEGFGELAISYLRTETGIEVEPAEDRFSALASLEPFANVAYAMAGSGRVVARVAADLRLLASGPVGGIGEVTLPALQPGSSIMPGKVNPVLPELVMQVSYQLAGAAHAVQLAAGAGELEVAVMGPVVTDELLRGLARLGRVAVRFAELCVTGLSWDRERVEANLRGSLKAAVESIERVGYERAAYGPPEERGSHHAGQAER